jgi:hypothetical protein
LAGALRAFTSLRTLKPKPFEATATSPIQLERVSSEKFVSRLHAFVGICRAFDLEPVLMTQPVVSVRVPSMPEFMDPRNQEIFNQLIRDVAGKENVVLIDLARHLAEDVEGWNEPMKVFYDGVHVTNLGSRIYAEYIVQRLLESVLQPPRISPRSGAERRVRESAVAGG